MRRMIENGSRRLAFCQFVDKEDCREGNREQKYPHKEQIAGEINNGSSRNRDIDKENGNDAYDFLHIVPELGSGAYHAERTDYGYQCFY